MGQNLTPYWQLSSQGAFFPFWIEMKTVITVPCDDFCGLVSWKLIIFLIPFITWEQWSLTVKLELPRNRDLYLFKIVLIFINLLLWSGYTELRTDAFSVRSFAPNSVNSEQCKQAKSCCERIVQTVHTERAVRTANRANNHTNSSYCWNIVNSTNSSFLRNRRTGRTGANTVRWSLLIMKGYQSAICSWGVKSSILNIQKLNTNSSNMFYHNKDSARKKSLVLHFLGLI